MQEDPHKDVILPGRPQYDGSPSVVMIHELDPSIYSIEAIASKLRNGLTTENVRSNSSFRKMLAPGRSLGSSA